MKRECVAVLWRCQTCGVTGAMIIDSTPEFAADAAAMQGAQESATDKLLEVHTTHCEKPDIGRIELGADEGADQALLYFVQTQLRSMRAERGNPEVMVCALEALPVSASDHPFDELMNAIRPIAAAAAKSGDTAGALNIVSEALNTAVDGLGLTDDQRACARKIIEIHQRFFDSKISVIGWILSHFPSFPRCDMGKVNESLDELLVMLEKTPEQAEAFVGKADAGDELDKDDEIDPIAQRMRRHVFN